MDYSHRIKMPVVPTFLMWKECGGLGRLSDHTLQFLSGG